MSDGIKRQDSTNWRPATQLVRGGTTRSAHGETSEALFLNSGFRYDSAASAGTSARHRIASIAARRSVPPARPPSARAPSARVR